MPRTACMYTLRKEENMKKKEVRPFRNLVGFSSSGESLILLKVASCVRDFDCWTPYRGGR